MAIRVAVIETWDETDVLEGMTAQQALAATGVEFDPETQRLVSAKDGEIKPDAIVQDGDTIFVEALEGDDADEVVDDEADPGKKTGDDAVVDEADPGKKTGDDAVVDEADPGKKTGDDAVVGEAGAGGGGGEAVEAAAGGAGAAKE